MCVELCFANKNSGLGCAGYEDFLLKVHEKLSTSEAPVDVVPDASAALEAAWAAEPPVMEPPVEPVEPPVEPVVDVAVQQQIAALELKVQEAMRRTARAQVQLRRKKAEELLLTGLMKHLKAACKVYQEREPSEEHQDGEKKGSLLAVRTIWNLFLFLFSSTPSPGFPMIPIQIVIMNPRIS